MYLFIAMFVNAPFLVMNIREVVIITAINGCVSCISYFIFILKKVYLFIKLTHHHLLDILPIRTILFMLVDKSMKYFSKVTINFSLMINPAYKMIYTNTNAY